MRVVVRGDSGFCREELMAWCEVNEETFVLLFSGDATTRALN